MKKIGFIIASLWSFAVLAQDQLISSFNQQYSELIQSYVSNDLVDYQRLKADQQGKIQKMYSGLDGIEPERLDAEEQKAFWINVYNFLVIYGIVEAYPINSTQKIYGFFTEKKFDIAGKQRSLNGIESSELLQKYQDPRVHFAIVCGAVGCPPLINKIFQAENLDQLLEERTRSALNDSRFVQYDPNTAVLRVSEIFKWYQDEFVKHSGSVIAYINQYRNQPVNSQVELDYIPYDWKLNDQNSTQRATPQPYRASFLLPKKGVEVKLFNAIYTQGNFDGFSELNSRSTYMSSFAQFLIGVNSRINVGFDAVYKSNLVNDRASSSPLGVLKFEKYSEIQKLDNGENFANADGDVLETRGDHGLSHLGPKIKFSPIKKWPNVSLQQTMYIPIKKSVDGQTISFTQLFFDKMLGRKSQLFSEISLWTPVAPNFDVSSFFKVFISYFPTPKWTLYGTTTIPKEYGVGVKRYITPQFEMEFLYTYYLPVDKWVGFTRPYTLNLGFRYTNL